MCNAAERVEWWCNVHGSFSTWSAKTVLEYMHREARDIHDRLQAAVAGTSSAAVEGKHLAAAKPRALRALIGDDDPDDRMFKCLQALIRLAKSVGTCTATWWYLAVDLLALTCWFSNHTHQFLPVCCGRVLCGHNRCSL